MSSSGTKDVTEKRRVEKVIANGSSPFKFTMDYMSANNLRHNPMEFDGLEDRSSIVQAMDDLELEQVLQHIDLFSFDIFRIRYEDLPKVVERIFTDLNMFKHLQLDVGELRTFVETIMSHYHSHVRYHNFRHACDVLHAVFLLLRKMGAEHKLNPLERLALLLSALCHDADHPGLTNSFLVACNSPLAICYNGVSVLENHHAALTRETLMGPKCTDLLKIFSRPAQSHICELITQCILATDIAQHGAILSDLSAEISANEEGRPSRLFEDHKIDGLHNMQQDTSIQFLDPVTDSDTLLLMKLLLKCADISNIWKPFFLSRRWTLLLSLEWFCQGDLEKGLGIPISKYMSREDSDSLSNMSIGFIENVGKPMFSVAAHILPKMHEELMSNLSVNLESWMLYLFPAPIEA